MNGSRFRGSRAAWPEIQERDPQALGPFKHVEIGPIRFHWAEDALDHVVFTFGNSRPRRWYDMSGFDEKDLPFRLPRITYLHGSFHFAAIPVTEDCKVEYEGPIGEDVIMKVFRGHTQMNTAGYEYVGCVHALAAYRRPVFMRKTPEPYFLGIEMHRNVNQKVFAPLAGTHGRGKQIQERVDLCNKTPGKGRADQADFLLLLGPDEERNLQLMKLLWKENTLSGPWGEHEKSVAFCTDCSIGLGLQVDGTVLLDLWRCDFAQALKPAERWVRGSWLEVFKRAIARTKYGALSCIPSDARRRREGLPAEGQLLMAEAGRRFVYLHRDRRIIAAETDHLDQPGAGSKPSLRSSPRGSRTRAQSLGPSAVIQPPVSIKSVGSAQIRTALQDSPQTIRIFVELPAGYAPALDAQAQGQIRKRADASAQECELQVASKDRVVHIQQQLQELLGIPPKKQRLFHLREELPTLATVAECNLRQNSRIRLVLKATTPRTAVRVAAQ